MIDIPESSTLSRYNLNALGDAEFENMIQSLLKRVIGAGTLTFGAGRDGAREATFNGTAPYPSAVDNWSGNWVFQVKFHETELVGMGRARNDVISDTSKELETLTTKYKQQIDNYIMITNVPLSGVRGRGTLDRIESEVFSHYRSKVPNLAIWGADDVNRFLDIYPEVRQPYVPLLITGDIIAELLTQVDQAKSDRATTIDLYLRTAITREENAQLDQAGDVSEDAIPLQSVFFDLDTYVQSITKEASERYQNRRGAGPGLPYGEGNRVSMVRYLISASSPDRTVIVGGPGEGKSTIGQYLAQLHRATLLGKADDIAISSEYIPETPRLPFRVVLKDFAQWLADQASDSYETASLDSYLCEQVARLSARDFGERDLHEVLKTNPVLLVLDGLDEVTDTVVRKRLVTRLVEFLDRSQNGLRCNLQVVATTRPTNYRDQFDPKTFIHFRLHKLQDQQVRNYVGKWIIARVLEESKATRLRETINECLADGQISLLMTTPLQVSILILIINGGGTPPRQREALFDEYLEVIYKREKAKGLGIVKTEKELLISLHKFIGYLLQEESTNARTSSATLSRPIYDKIVMAYLRNHDPYSPDNDIEAEWHAITVDAGDRLVLLVESPANIFGFELRSIQEFFAACYLSDTAINTDQRYKRLARIAYLPHWRNVTLFFAGRAGRSYPGEAANIIEVCKGMDRTGPDFFVKRGAEVALELAAERALGPNRVLQRSLLEHGLSLFDSPMSASARRANIDLVRRLPFEDIRDHVIPIMEQRLPTLGNVAICNACYLLSIVAPESDILRSNLLRLAAEAGREYASELAYIISRSGIRSDVRIQTIRTLLNVHVDPELIGQNLGRAQWPTMCSIAADLTATDIDTTLVQAFASTAAVNAAYFARATEDSSVEPDEGSSLSILLKTARAAGALAATRGYNTSVLMSAIRAEPVRQRLAVELPESVRLGQIEMPSASIEADRLMWLTHIALGDVTPDSWEHFVAWLTDHPLNEGTKLTWSYITGNVSPIASAVSRVSDFSYLIDLSSNAVSFAGNNGFRHWLKSLETLQNKFILISELSRHKFLHYGPAVLAAEERSICEEALNSEFDLCLQPVALEWLDEPRQEELLSDVEFDRLSEWFGSLPANSPWRTQSIASSAAGRAVALGRIGTTSAKVFVDALDDYMVVNIALSIAAFDDENDELLRPLLMHPTLQGRAFDPSTHTVPVMSRKRRGVIQKFLKFSDDHDANVRRVACAIVTGICFAAGDEESRSAIRSHELDMKQERLIASPDSVERGAGIALYVVRPPRSVAEWTKLGHLFKSVSIQDVEDYWSWVLPFSVHLAANPELWIQSITPILDSGVDKRLAIVLGDVLRALLPRESQSLAPVRVELGLPDLNDQVNI